MQVQDDSLLVIVVGEPAELAGDGGPDEVLEGGCKAEGGDYLLEAFAGVLLLVCRHVGEEGSEGVPDSLLGGCRFVEGELMGEPVGGLEVNHRSPEVAGVVQVLDGVHSRPGWQGLALLDRAGNLKVRDRWQGIPLVVFGSEEQGILPL
jgi:hypothetical protein